MRAYDEMLKRAVTAFYLPAKSVGTDYAPVSIPATASEAEEAEDKLRRIPFPCIRVVRTSNAQKDLQLAKVVSDIVCESISGEFFWSSKETLTNSIGTRKVVYHPEDIPLTVIALPRGYLELIDALSDRRNAYIEQSVSRQVRRASGFSSTYREYIVVRRKDVAGSLTLGQLIRRHPQLHAVRGHLRHYSTGRISFVRPHLRGQGDALQVKDYVIR